MKRNKNIKEALTRTGKAGVAAAVVFACAVSCKDVQIGQIPTDNVPPPPVMNVQIVPTPGGATISYDLPDETDINYVYCEYVFNGVKKNTRSSIYNNSLIIEGLPDNLSSCDFTIYMVDHSENRSVPYKDSFIPEEPLYLVAAKTVTWKPDFGGITFYWENETEAIIGASLLVREDNGDWKDYDLAFSTRKSDRRSIRGQESIEREFGLVLMDQWNNYGDTIPATVTPLYEKMLNKSLFTNAAFSGDNNSANGSRPLSKIWDGIAGSSASGAAVPESIWHSVSTDPNGQPPQTFTIDLGVDAQLSRVELFNRTGNVGYSYNQFNPRLFKVWGLLESPTNPVRSDAYWDPRTGGAWREDMILLGSFEVIKQSGLPLGQVSEADEKAEADGFNFDFEPGVGNIRFVRFEVEDVWGTSKTALHIAEVSIYGNDFKE